MATKQAKVRTKPKKNLNISPPYSFKHVQHVAPSYVNTSTITTTTDTITTSIDSSSIINSISTSYLGHCRPISAPVIGMAADQMYSNVKEMDTPLLLTKDTLKELITSEIASAIKAELEPIKQSQERLECRLEASGMFTDTAEYSEIEISDQVAYEYQEDEGEDPTYVNLAPFQRARTRRRLKHRSLSNPTYFEYSDDNIIPVNESRSETHFGEFSLSSQTSLKKPKPSPRLRNETRPNHASDDSTAAHNSRDITRSLSNPSHDKCEEPTGLQRIDNESKVLMQSSVSSETSLKRHMLPLPAPRPKSPRPNTIPRGRSLQTGQRRPSEPMYHRRGHQADERQCLAKALQSNIEDIVDNLIFTGSELPDQLAQDSCVTDEESSDIRNIPNKKDQIRVLISTIKGRDLRVLQRFLARIEKTNKHIADKITTSYEENKRTLKTKHLCACCEMRGNVNIKYVVDGLWSIDAISDCLYKDIARCSYSTVEQNTLWQRLIDSLNNACKDLRQVAYRRLVRALSSKNHYKYIAVDIETSISKNGRLECKCQVHYCPAGSFTGTTFTSMSPWSSVSDVRVSNEKFCGTGEFKRCECRADEFRSDELAGPDAPDGGDISQDGGYVRGSQKDDFFRESDGGHDPVKETPIIQISSCSPHRIVRQNAVDG